MSLLRQLRTKLDTRKISAIELTQHYLQKIKQINPSLNAFITVSKTEALKQAEAADKCIQEGAQRLLTGIPVAHKDNFCTKGVLTTCASKMLSNFKSPFNATVVQKLEDQGMVMLGKTNMDEFGMGSNNENSFYGPVHNPWHIEYTPGGSSGGAAAAVAGNMTPIATGSDTGGSVRQPASFCGVTGMKPSYGSVSRFGLIAYASSFDQAGVIATSAYDVAKVLRHIQGIDQKDGTTVNAVSDLFTQSLEHSLKNLSIGIDAQLLQQLPTKMQDLFQAVIKQFSQQGVLIKNIELPDLKPAVSTYYILAPAEAATNLARFDGVRYGYRSDKAKTLDELYTNTRTEGFGQEVKRRIVMGNYVLAASQYDAYYHKAQQIRRLLAQAFDKLYQSVDMILLPSAQNTAPKLGEQKDPVSIYLNDLYTLLANLTGGPAISFPIGMVDGLPCGAQLMAGNFRDYLLTQAVHQFQQATDFHCHHASAQGVD